MKVYQVYYLHSYMYLICIYMYYIHICFCHIIYICVLYMYVVMFISYVSFSKYVYFY